MSKKSSLVLFAVAVFALGALSGCGDRQVNQDTAGPPIPDTPKGGNPESGAPLFFFGQGGNRVKPGETDEDYQEYLLWKEWQQYQKYKEWLKNNPSAQPSDQSSE